MVQSATAEVPAETGGWAPIFAEVRAHIDCLLSHIVLLTADPMFAAGSAILEEPEVADDSASAKIAFAPEREILDFFVVAVHRALRSVEVPGAP